MLQAQNVQAQDTITLNFVASDREHGAVGRTFVFDGTGRQIVPQRNGRGLAVPAPAAAGDRPPQLDMNEYLRLTRVNGPEEGRQLKRLIETYNAQLAAYNAGGGAGRGRPLQVQLAEAANAFLRAEGVIAADGNGWTAEVGATLVTVPARAFDGAPIGIVIQPTPVWGINL